MLCVVWSGMFCRSARLPTERGAMFPCYWSISTRALRYTHSQASGADMHVWAEIIRTWSRVTVQRFAQPLDANCPSLKMEQKLIYVGETTSGVCAAQRLSGVWTKTLFLIGPLTLAQSVHSSEVVVISLVENKIYSGLDSSSVWEVCQRALQPVWWRDTHPWARDAGIQ